MVWGCFTAAAVGPLVKIEDKGHYERWSVKGYFSKQFIWRVCPVRLCIYFSKITSQNITGRLSSRDLAKMESMLWKGHRRVPTLTILRHYVIFLNESLSKNKYQIKMICGEFDGLIYFLSFSLNMYFNNCLIVVLEYWHIKLIWHKKL